MNYASADSVLNIEMLLQALEKGNPEVINTVRLGFSSDHKFVVLRHKRRNSVSERLVGVDAIEKTTQYSQGMGGSVSEPVVKRSVAYFVPEPQTLVRYAFMLVTEHNKNVLATHLDENRWDILDENILAEVKKISESMKKKIDQIGMQQPITMQQVVKPTTVFMDMNTEDLEVQRLAREKELEDIKNAISKKAEAIGVKEKVDSTRYAPETGVGWSLEKAKEYVLKKEKALIDSLGERWWLTKAYKAKIKPQIDALVRGEFTGIEEKQAETPVKIPKETPLPDAGSTTPPAPDMMAVLK